MSNPEERNYAEIERLEALLAALREDAGTARETEAIREIGLEIAIAIREVGAMMVNVAWEQWYTAQKEEGPAARPIAPRPSLEQDSP